MKISNRTIVTVGMCAAMLSVLSLIAIPMPNGMPLTLQTFAVALCGYVLGARRGMMAVLIYLLLGAVGIPVFSGMHGGISWLIGYTGGFLWGFVFLTMMCGIALRAKKMVVCVLMSGAGILLCHVVGVIWFAWITETKVVQAFITVSAPYLIKDVISIIGAYEVAKPIRGVIKRRT